VHPAGTSRVMLESVARPDETTDATGLAAPHAPAAVRAIGGSPPATSLHSLVNPPLVALGLAVLFLLALLVAVMIGSDSETASADEAGAAFPTHTAAALDGRTA
jgi:hypothetical protein